jgi:hypothetical protein
MGMRNGLVEWRYRFGRHRTGRGHDFGGAASRGRRRNNYRIALNTLFLVDQRASVGRLKNSGSSGRSLAPAAWIRLQKRLTGRGMNRGACGIAPHFLLGVKTAPFVSRPARAAIEGVWRLTIRKRALAVPGGDIQ